MQIYLDACAIIEAIEKQTSSGQAIVDLIADAAREETPFLTSELSLLEVLVVPIRGLVDRSPEDEDAIRRSYHDWYYDNLTEDGLLIQTRPVTRDILIQAALIRARTHSIKTPDAIHVATAYRLGCTHFVTDDVELSRKLGRENAWSGSERRVGFVSFDVAELRDLRAELGL